MILWENAVVGIIQLLVAIVFSVIALYAGFLVLNWITREIDEEKELAQGNAAVGIFVASVFIAIALVVQSGVSGLSVGINRALSIGILTGDGILTVVIAVVQLFLGIILAVGSIYLALRFLDRLTSGVNEFEELRKGNVAVALEMAGVIIAVAVIIQTGVIGITAAIL
ncbi:MAG TPA: DUF350 domain-containing protein [Methanoregula sp.]|nr:DUF350 domain-containing protein [Methanoregula sp.]